MIEVGDPAPGLPAGAVVALIGDAPRIDADGNVALEANVRGVAGHPIVQALYRAGAHGPRLAVRSGDEVPGALGLFTLFPALPATPRIDRGRLTFAATTDAPGTGSAGIWSDRAGGFASLVRAGDRLAAMPDGAALGDFSFSTRGSEVLLNGAFGNGGPRAPGDRGLWRGGTHGWRPLVVGGAPAPGLGEGVVFAADPTGAFGPFFAFDAVAGGAAVVQAWVAGPGIDPGDDEALWIAGGAGLSPLVREGDPAPGRPDLTFGPSSASPVFGGFRENLPVLVGPGGAVTFGAVLTGAQGRLNSVWTVEGGEPRLVALGAPPVAGYAKGDPAPGLAPGATFATFEAGDLDPAGRLAIQATSSERGDAVHRTRGLWRRRGIGLALVAAAGHPAPGLAGVSVADLRLERMTAGGLLLFTARLAGEEVTPADDQALFAAGEGGVVPILREGDPARVVAGAAGSGGRVRTVAAFRLGDGDSRDGRVALEVVFRDGSSGVYRLALPAPSGAAP